MFKKKQRLLTTRSSKTSHHGLLILGGSESVRPSITRQIDNIIHIYIYIISIDSYDLIHDLSQASILK